MLFLRIQRLFFCFDSGQILATGAKYLPEIQTLIFQAVMTEIGLRMRWISSNIVDYIEFQFQTA